MGDRAGDTVVQVDSPCRRVQPWLWGSTLGGACSAVRSPAWAGIILAPGDWSKEVDWKSECVRKGRG